MPRQAGSCLSCQTLAGSQSNALRQCHTQVRSSSSVPGARSERLRDSSRHCSFHEEGSQCQVHGLLACQQLREGRATSEESGGQESRRFQDFRGCTSGLLCRPHRAKNDVLFQFSLSKAKRKTKTA